MRPKRNILLWAECEVEAGILAFTLNTQKNLAVTKVDDDRQFQKVLEKPWDCVVIPHAYSDKVTTRKAQLARRAQGLLCPILLLTFVAEARAPQTLDADFVMPYGSSAAEIIGRIQLMVQRKRGPKPGAGRMQATEVA